jgi:hypothetical protein
MKEVINEGGGNIHIEIETDRSTDRERGYRKQVRKKELKKRKK